jgi:hypothetical protein
MREEHCFPSCDAVQLWAASGTQADEKDVDSVIAPGYASSSNFKKFQDLNGMGNCR